MHLHDRFAEFLSASEIIEATPALLNDQRRRFVSSPDIVLQPNSVESVQKIMRFCFENRPARRQYRIMRGNGNHRRYTAQPLQAKPHPRYQPCRQQHDG